MPSIRTPLHICLSIALSSYIGILMFTAQSGCPATVKSMHFPCRFVCFLYSVRCILLYVDTYCHNDIFFHLDGISCHTSSGRGNQFYGSRN
jgi:hypothetical protein